MCRGETAPETAVYITGKEQLSVTLSPFGKIVLWNQTNVGEFFFFLFLKGK